MGTKDIAVPFSALQWKTESRQVPAGDAVATNPIGSTGGGKPPMKTVDSAAIEAHQGYPDKAMLNMTLVQLQAAPDFRFVPDPTQSEEASQGAEQRTQPKSNP